MGWKPEYLRREISRGIAPTIPVAPFGVVAAGDLRDGPFEHFCGGLGVFVGAAFDQGAGAGGEHGPVTVAFEIRDVQFDRGVQGQSEGEQAEHGGFALFGGGADQPVLLQHADRDLLGAHGHAPGQPVGEHVEFTIGQQRPGWGGFVHGALVRDPQIQHSGVGVFFSLGPDLVAVPTEVPGQQFDFGAGEQFGGGDAHR